MSAIAHKSVFCQSTHIETASLKDTCVSWEKNSTSIFDNSLWTSVFNALRLSAEKTLRRERKPCINVISSLRKMFPLWPISRVKNIHKCTGFKLCFYRCFIYLSLRAKFMRRYNSASIISELWNNHCWRFLSENSYTRTPRISFKVPLSRKMFCFWLNITWLALQVINNNTLNYSSKRSPEIPRSETYTKED